MRRARQGRRRPREAVRAVREILPFEQLYCEKCGELSIPIQRDEIAPRLDLDPRPALVTQAPALLAGLALAMGVGALLLAAIEIVR
jgi:hypothetical protein